MKYLDIKNKLKNFKIFSLNYVFLVDPNFRQATLYDWEKIGYVNKIRNRWYYFSDNIPSDKELYFVANKLYKPSYISVELALNHYGLIPESVFSITSVTTRKTIDFSTPLGNFVYNSIDPKLFFGYGIYQIGVNKFKMAYMEKAILDFLYFHNSIEDEAGLFEVRFDYSIIKKSFNKDLLLRYIEIFDNQRLNKLIKILLKNI